DADGLLADEEPLADLAVRPAFRDQRQHLAFPAGEPERVLAGGRRVADHAADDRRPWIVRRGESVASRGPIPGVAGSIGGRPLTVRPGPDRDERRAVMTVGAAP